MSTNKLAVICTLGWVLALGWSSAASAACDSAVLQKLLDSGFTREEILAVCGGGPAAPVPGAPVAPAGPPATPAAPPAIGQGGPPAGIEEPPPAERHPAELVGSWSGRMEPIGWGTQMSLAGDGSYTLYVEGAPGAYTSQTGRWWVEGAMFAMRPDTATTGGRIPLPLPPQTEYHPYQLGNGGTTLIIKGSGGEMRLTRN